METIESDSDDSDSNNSDSDKQPILTLSNYTKEVLIYITSEKEKIGYIKGVLLNGENIFNELESDEILKILEFADSEKESEMKSFYIQVLSKKKLKDNAFYITELFIEKEHRKKGVGRKLFDKLPEFLRKHIIEPIAYIYLMPGPLEKINGEVKYIMNSKDEQMVSLKQRLIKFYKSVGFKRIGKTEFYYKEQAS
ncbi:GNAT family N-acetyltransferase [Maledivibacter halophilus]|uniref:Acetyltransferases n=1 Tax=Maledivibacter halophilus TaxID=36842 RepID=A0A1T5IBC7_9FIRM|nr:GNAT family N-acetyltransferase [Maledivibacter halophilus]SKC36455.1 Acetyltransferases [Maledivibacter halophilus]